MKKTTKELRKYIETLKDRQTAYTRQIEIMRNLSQNYSQSILNVEEEIRLNLKQDIIEKAKYQEGQIFKTNFASNIEYIKIIGPNISLWGLKGDENPDDYNVPYKCFVKRYGPKTRWSRVEQQFLQSEINQMTLIK